MRLALLALLAVAACAPNRDKVRPDSVQQNTEVQEAPAMRGLYRVAAFNASMPSLNLENTPVVMTLNPPMVDMTGLVIGDSLRIIATWRQPTDGGGNADSTTFRIKGSRTIRFTGGGTVTPDTWRRRKHTTALADTFKFLLPAIKDSIVFQADSIQQWRQGDGSVPGSAAGSYVRSAAPPSMTFTATTREVF